MAIESDADRLSFLNVDEFGVEVTLNPGSQSPTVINGIFDAGHVEIDNGYSVISTAEPMVLCRTADVATLSQNDTLKVNGTNYTVADIQDDGTGMSEVRIHRA